MDNYKKFSVFQKSTRNFFISTNRFFFFKKKRYNFFCFDKLIFQKSLRNVFKFEKHSFNKKLCKLFTQKDMFLSLILQKCCSLRIIEKKIGTYKELSILVLICSFLWKECFSNGFMADLLNDFWVIGCCFLNIYFCSTLVLLWKWSCDIVSFQ